MYNQPWFAPKYFTLADNNLKSINLPFAANCIVNHLKNSLNLSKIHKS